MIPRTAHPLSWPQGRERCRVRERADFHRQKKEVVRSANDPTKTWESKSRVAVSIAHARDELLREIKLLGARDVVLSSNLVLNQFGEPHGSAREPPDPGVAVFFSLKKTDTCIAVDRFDRVADNMLALAKTIAAIRGIERWGGATLVTAAFRGFQALPEHAGGRAWHEVFGVLAHAPEETVEAVARSMLARFHPDSSMADATKYDEASRARDQFRAERGLA